MKDLSIAQEYALCALDKEVKSKDWLFDYKYPVCIVISAFWELFMCNAIKSDEKNKLVVANDLDSSLPHLGIIYDRISSEKPKTFKQWIESYSMGFSGKPTNIIIEAVVEELIENNCIETENKKGIFKEKVIYHTDKLQVNTIIEKIRAEFLEKGELTDETTILTALMLKSGVLENFFSKHESNALKDRIKEIQSDDSWKLIKNILDDIDVAFITVIC